MAKASVPQTRAAKNTVTVTYRPLEYSNGTMDPARTKWNGITFEANVPVELDPENPAHYVTQLVVKGAQNAEGEMRTKAVEAKVFMGEMAKNNPSFEVDGRRAKRKVNTRIVPPPGAEWTEQHEGQISNSEELDQSVAA